MQYSVEFYLRHYRVKVAQHRYDDLQTALLGRITLLEHFRSIGIPVRATSVRRLP